MVGFTELLSRSTGRVSSDFQTRGRGKEGEKEGRTTWRGRMGEGRWVGGGDLGEGEVTVKGGL